MSDIGVDKFGRVIAAAFARNVAPKLDGELISNALMARDELFGSLLDPRRDLNAECHYPETGEVGAQQYKDLYERDPIACRVTQCLPRESWQVQPQVYESEDPDVTTLFEEAWDALQPMTTGKSWYKTEEAGSVWDYLLRADILSGIGHFGVLLMGFDDGKNLQDPVEGALITNAFCPTGEGGGVDPSCGNDSPVTKEHVQLARKTAGTKKTSIGEVHDQQFLHEKVLSPVEDELKRRGYKTQLNHSESTNSSYLLIQLPDNTVKGEIRLSDHPRYSGGRNTNDRRVNGGRIRHSIGYKSAQDYADRLNRALKDFPGAVHNQRQTIPDCFLTKVEEDNLRALPNINELETAVINQLANQREFIINAMQAKQPQYKQSRPQDAPAFGTTTGEHEPPTADGIEGTDRQYDQQYGLVGEAQYKSDGSGSEQQYFGVQFGPSERQTDTPSKQRLKLLFLRPFDESMVQIVRYEWNVGNPRFGMPVMYRITLNDPRDQHSGVGLPMATVFVHWSRVIHFADNLNSSEIFGSPRMRPVLNRLLDLQKIYGASAEGYWQAAFTGIALETHPQLGGDVTIDSADVKNQLENYVNSLQRYLALTGMSAHTLAPQVSDPTSQIAGHIEAICIQMGIPIRIFKGSERGELASSQDDAQWNDRIRARQLGYVTPRIIVPFIDRLISVGVLPEPTYVEPIEEPLGADGLPVDDFESSFLSEDGLNPNDPMDDDLVEQDPAIASDPDPDLEDDEDWVDFDTTDDEEDRSPASLTSNAFNGSQDEEQSEADKAEFDDGDDEEIATDERLDEQEPFGAEKPPVAVKAKMGYTVLWPDLDSNTDQGKAQIAATQVQAMATYVSGNVESILPLLEFYTKVLKFTDEEARVLVAQAEEQQMEDELKQAEQQQQMAEQGMPFGQPQPGQPPFGQEPGQEPPQFDGPPKPPQFGGVPKGEPNPPFVDNAFCPTGEGGGVDPSCGGGSSSSSLPSGSGPDTAIIRKGDHPAGLATGVGDGYAKWPAPLVDEAGIEDAASLWSGQTGGIQEAARGVGHIGNEKIDPNSPVFRGFADRTRQWASTLVTAVDRGKVSKELYRGFQAKPEEYENIRSLNPGDSLDLNLTSWSSKSSVARYYSDAEVLGKPEDTPVIFRVVGAKGLSMAKYSEVPAEKEWITDGRFTVVSVTEESGGSVYKPAGGGSKMKKPAKRVVVELKQVHTWKNPVDSQNRS